MAHPPLKITTKNQCNDYFNEAFFLTFTPSTPPTITFIKVANINVVIVAKTRWDNRKGQALFERVKQLLT